MDHKAINAICTPFVKDDMSSVALHPSDVQLEIQQNFPCGRLKTLSVKVSLFYFLFQNIFDLLVLKIRVG